MSQRVSAPAAELVMVGDELLAGRTQDTDSHFLCRELTSIGLSPQCITTVRDEESEICGAVKSALDRAGLVLVVGGLGPTSDDRTLAALAAGFGLRLVQDRKTGSAIEEKYCRMNSKMPALALKQALVPRGATLFANPVGMVPGIVFEAGASAGLVALLPGVPQEMEAIFRTGLAPFLSARCGLRVTPSARIRTFGVPEAVMAQRIGRIALPAGVVLGYYPSTRGVDVVVRADTKSSLSSARAKIARLLGGSVYETGDREMEEVVGSLLRKRGWTMATAESCTGGLIGDRLTGVPGSSDYYAGGVVAYGNEAKIHLLGVRPSTLRRCGAVSATVVKGMAVGARVQLNADVGLSVSGIAGPSGATRTKPVGLVHVGFSLEQGEVLASERFRFFGTRRMVKERAAQAALDLARRVLESVRRG